MSKIKFFLSFTALTCLCANAYSYDKINLTGTSSKISGTNSLVLDGVRVTGMGSDGVSRTYTDALRLTYTISPGTLSTKLTSTVVFPNIGTYNLDYMSKDVSPALPSYSVNGSQYSGGVEYVFSATPDEPFVASFAAPAGYMLSARITGPTGDSEIYIVGGDNNNPPLALPRTTNSYGIQGLITPANSNYQIKIHPTSDPISFKLIISNANNQTLKSISNGTAISIRPTTGLRSYSKYVANLSKGTTLSLAAAKNTNYRFTILDAYGAKHQETIGFLAPFSAPTSGKYYAFIENITRNNSTLSGNFTISSAAASTDRQSPAENPSNSPLYRGLGEIQLENMTDQN